MPKKYPVTRKKKSSFLSTLSGVIAFGVVLAGLLFATLLAKENQDLRQQASGEQNPVKLSFRSSAVDDTHMKLDVLINTWTYQLAAADIQGSLSGTTEGVTLENGSSLALDSVKDQIAQSNSVTSFRIVRFALVNPGAQTSSNNNDVPLFSFIITKPQNNQVTVSINAAASSVAVLGMSNIAVQFPTAQSYTLQTQADLDNNRKSCGQNCATDPECKSNLVCYKGMCRSKSNLEDQFCGTPPDQGIHRSCNEYCADNKECASDLVCYFNQCRNPKNLKNSSCTNPATPRPSSKPTTTAVSPSPLASVLPSGSKVTAIDGIPVRSPSPTPEFSPFGSPFLPSARPTPSPSVIPSINPSPSSTVQSQQNNSNMGKLLVIIGAIVGIGVIYIAYQKLYK
jgi:hypothetical protein